MAGLHHFLLRSRSTRRFRRILIALAIFSAFCSLQSVIVYYAVKNVMEESSHNRPSSKDIDPNFAPGRIGELCGPADGGGGEKRIFFIESSGEECLRPRQACAIESAALTNPDMTIYVHMSLRAPPGRPEEDRGEGLERHCRTMELIRALPNVRIIYEDDLLGKYLKGTPLEPLYHSGAFNRSRYALQHISDAVRIAILYQYGGIYLDLDVVVLRSLRCLRNSAGHVDVLGQVSVENDVLAFDAGHKFLRFFMRWMAEGYRPDQRAAIGPLALTNVFKAFCKLPADRQKFSEDSDETFLCHKETPVTLMKPLALHPIAYFEQNRFYACDSPLSEEVERLRSGTYSVHVYGSGHGAHVPRSSLFAFLAERFCPSVYSESLPTLSGTYEF